MEIGQQEKIRRKIRSWMVGEGMLCSNIARDLGYGPNAGAVSHFLMGRITCKKLRDYFLDKGCPVELIYALDKIRKDIKKKEATWMSLCAPQQ